MIDAHMQAAILIALPILAVCIALAAVGVALAPKPPKVVTEYWPKPIPYRHADWIAWYDGDEPNDAGQMAHGEGATEREAIRDLLESAPRGEPRDASSILSAIAVCAFIAALALWLP